MSSSRPRRRALIPLLVLIAIPVGLTWRTVRLDGLNHSLIAAVKGGESDRVIDLLARGADANVCDEPPVNAPLWQRILTVMHIGAKGESSLAPSVLRLAFEWRPGPDRSIATSSDVTPLIPSLLDHGARLGGPEIMARMARKYAFCASYKDTGTVNIESQSLSESFHTAFVRPNRLCFEFTDGFTGANALWENGDGAYRWFASDGRPVKEPSMEMAIAGATGISFGTAAMVPVLLMPDQLSGWGGPREVTDAKLAGITSLDGVPCYEVTFPGGHTTYWVDRKTDLLRKVNEDMGGGMVTTAMYHPLLNVPIAADVFRLGHSK